MRPGLVQGASPARKFSFAPVLTRLLVAPMLAPLEAPLHSTQACFTPSWAGSIRTSTIQEIVVTLEGCHHLSLDGLRCASSFAFVHDLPGLPSLYDYSCMPCILL
ncbi:hypothetical protein PENSPDRAFT_654592 [Peniophora sp. CONT]|nr:hypothetical protein PENSPDRAFT_654592 [Peniophora sp. CONT]